MAVEPKDLVGVIGDSPKVVHAIAHAQIDPGTLREVYHIGAYIKHHDPAKRLATASSDKSLNHAARELMDGLKADSIQWDGRFRFLNRSEVAELKRQTNPNAHPPMDLRPLSVPTIVGPDGNPLS